MTPAEQNHLEQENDDRPDAGGSLRQVSVLWLLAQSDQPLTLNEAAGALQAPRSSVHRLLSSLVAEGWVIAEGRPKRYRPSLKVVELGFQVARKHRIRQVLVEAAIELAQRVQSSTFLGFYECGEMVYTDFIEVRGERVMPRLIATRFPAALTAYGRVALAYQPMDEVYRAVEPSLLSVTGKRAIRPEELQQALHRIRERGYDVSDRLRDPGVPGLAVPVFDGPNRASAALGVHVATIAADAPPPAELLEPALAAAQQASADLRYGPRLFP